MKRTLLVAVLAVVALTGAIAVHAAERSPATLMPADTAIYAEVNLTRIAGDGPEAVALREVLGKSQLLPTLRKLMEEDEKGAETLDVVLRLADGLAKTVGPRAGLSVSMNPAMMMMTGGSPQVLVVADLKDEAALTAVLQEVLPKLGLTYVQEEAGGPIRFAGGQVILTHTASWLALGSPAEVVEGVKKLEAAPSGASLASDPGFSRTLAGLPKDAVVTEYISGSFLQQMTALAAMAAPEFALPTPPEDGLAWAATLRVEQQDGKRMISAAWTTDLDKAAYMVEMPVVTAMIPAFERARESARKTQCLANVRALSVAMNLYLADHGQFPKADRWVEEMEEYGVLGRLKCPEDTSDAKCSYGMNWGFSGKPESAIKDAAKQVIFYETAHPGDTPRGGKTDVASPPRHQGGNNYGFVDGHAKWCQEPAGDEVQW
jgi:prepilin-type processing-associated H-X9-DG protein